MRSPPGARSWHTLPSPVPPHPVDRLLTPERAQLYRQVLARRTTRLAVVVEDCYDPHNATAIVRTCDAVGVQRMFIIAGRNPYKINRHVSQGSHHYLDLSVHPTIEDGYAAVRAAGYRILASDLSGSAVVGPGRLTEQLAAQPLALVFGTEGTGLSAAAVAAADGSFLIPMAGYTQSLNLSVAVAISLYTLRREALEADAPGDVPAQEQCSIYDRWVRAHKGETARKLLAQVGRHGEELDVLGGGPGGPMAEGPAGSPQGAG